MKNLFIGFGVFIFIFSSCKHEVDVPDCSTLSFTTTKTNDFCSNGSITILATGGGNVYSYSIDNGTTFQSENIFTNLNAGVYDIIVKDENDCEEYLVDTLVAEVGNLKFTYTTSDAGCGSTNGEVTVSATGGAGGYSYSSDGFNYQTSNVLTDLAQGTIKIYVKDSIDCISQKSVTINAGDISYANDIKAIVMASCAVTDCHDGNTSRTNLTVYTTLKQYKTSCITKVSNGSMPESPGTITSVNKQKLLCWLKDGAPNN